MLHSCIKGFLRAKKLWVNPPKAERAKPSLSSDYNLLFKNKIGESSLDIHRCRNKHAIAMHPGIFIHPNQIITCEVDFHNVACDIVQIGE